MRRLSLIALPIALSLAATAGGCFINGGDGDDDDDGQGGNTSANGTGNGNGNGTGNGTGNGNGSGNGSSMSTSSGTPGTPGWTAVPLLDDMTDPERTVFRAGNDLVAAIHFDSVDSGLIGTVGDEGTFSNGGAIYSAKQKEVTKLLFGGNRNGLCLLGTIDFIGFEKLADRIVAKTHACDIISSKDGGATFDIEANGVDQFGIEQVLSMRSLPTGGTFAVLNSRYFAKTSGAPGPNSLWDTTYAPEANPTFPNPIPDDQCHSGPMGGVPQNTGHVYVSADGARIAYTSTENDAPVICLSTDGGTSFFPKVIPGVSPDAGSFQPDGVAFASADVGIAFWGNNVYEGAQYIARTTDGGMTWSTVPFPADLASKGVEFKQAAFAPGGQVGYIVGYNYSNSVALMLKTTDGGSTWSSASGDLAAKVSEAGGSKLWSVFALDDNNVWVGGEHGVLMANEAGGQ